MTRQITVGDTVLLLEIACTVEMLEAVKAVDDFAFGGHHGITMRELGDIMNGRGYIMFLTLDDFIVAESQVVTQQIVDLNWPLPNRAAFCYGIGTHPDFQGRGIGKALLVAQEQMMAEMGYTEMFTTVRVENYASLKIFVGIGHEIVDRIPFYGDDIGENRLLLRRSLVNTVPCEHQGPPVEVEVAFGDDIDLPAHADISNLLQAGYIGTGVTKGGIVFQPR